MSHDKLTNWSRKSIGSIDLIDPSTRTQLMGQDAKILPIFARHETFHPRFGWLKKGFEKTMEDELVFSKESAPVVLGVGKNMAKAIKYWCVAFKVIDEIRDNGRYIHRPTQFAIKLLMEGGWDPFLENPASLWLLHWKLFKPICYSPSWYFTFNELNKIDFTVDDILFSLKEFKNHHFPKNNVQDSSLSKDINCLLRMYVEKSGHRNLKEDSLDSPFTDLGIINAYRDSKRFAFNFGHKPSLPPEIVVAASLEFACFLPDDAKTISISRLLYDSGGPGHAFKLTESAFCDAIETVSKKVGNLYLADTAGMIQFVFEGDPSDLSERILDSYFRKGL